MKNLTKLGISMLMMSLTMTSCDDSSENGTGTEEGAYTKTQFLAYTEGIAYELSATATALSDAWTSTAGEDEDGVEYSNYADYFTNDVDPEDGLAWLKDGMATIANEVHSAKIGEPYEGKDVYGVESWYSFNSFVDYRDNLYSIQNIFYGKIITDSDAQRESMAVASADENSFAVTDANATALNSAMNAALVAINDLIEGGQPFRDYVLNFRDNGTDSQAIRDLIDLITDVETEINKLSTNNTIAEDIVAQATDVVIKPTYASLKSEAATLYTTIATYCADPTQSNLDAAAAQWIKTRSPWEQSEAFLFGPVDTEGYDPHLDSWPLSQSLINSILIQNVFPSNEEVGAIYRDEVLGFHAIEYVLFKAGSVRNVDELFDGDYVIIEATNEM